MAVSLSERILHLLCFRSFACYHYTHHTVIMWFTPDREGLSCLNLLSSVPIQADMSAHFASKLSMGMYYLKVLNSFSPCLLVFGFMIGFICDN